MNTTDYLPFADIEFLNTIDDAEAAAMCDAWAVEDYERATRSSFLAAQAHQLAVTATRRLLDLARLYGCDNASDVPLLIQCPDLPRLVTDVGEEERDGPLLLIARTLTEPEPLTLGEMVDQVVGFIYEALASAKTNLGGPNP